MKQPIMPKLDMITEGFEDFIDDPRSNGDLPDPVYRGPGFIETVLDRIGDVDFNEALGGYRATLATDEDASQKMADALVVGLVRAVDNDGYIHEGHLEAAAIAIRKGDANIATNLWVGSGGPWSESAGCNYELSGYSYEQLYALRPPVQVLADYVLGHALAANRGISEPVKVKVWTATSEEEVSRYRII